MPFQSWRPRRASPYLLLLLTAMQTARIKARARRDAKMISHSGGKQKISMNLGNKLVKTEMHFTNWPGPKKNYSQLYTWVQAKVQSTARQYWKNYFAVGLCPAGLLFSSLIISQDFQVPRRKTRFQKCVEWPVETCRCLWCNVIK